MQEKRIAVYSRKSKFTGRGESIENQVEMCRNYAELHFGAEQAEKLLIFEDEGFSGKDLERPKLQLMMERARMGGLKAIIVYRLDRISRSIADFAKLIEELGTLHVAFVSIREQFDTESPMGRAMMYIASVFSQLERETIAERIRDNMLELSKTGRWLGGRTPTGYVSEEFSKTGEDGRTRKCFRLKKVSQEADMVKEIYRIFLTTGSLAETVKRMSGNGYVSREGKAFSRHTLKGILQNPVYARADEAVLSYIKGQGAEVFQGAEHADGMRGLIAYNRTYQKTGSGTKMRRMQEWIISVGEHEGLVDGKTWTEAQRLLDQNHPLEERKRTGTGARGALLAGRLTCFFCRSPMRRKYVRGEENGRRRFIYLCTGKEREGKNFCRMKNAAGNLLEAELFHTLSRLEMTEEVFRRKLCVYRGTLKAGGSDAGLSSDELKRYRDELTCFEKMICCLEPAQQRHILKELDLQAVWDGKDLHVYPGGAAKPEDRIEAMPSGEDS